MSPAVSGGALSQASLPGGVDMWEPTGTAGSVSLCWAGARLEPGDVFSFHHRHQPSSCPSTTAAGSCLMLITSRTIALHQRPARRQQQQQAARGMLRVPPGSYLPNPCRGGAGGTAASLPSVAAQAVGKSGCMRAVHCFLVFLPPNIDNMGLSEDLAVNRA